MQRRARKRPETEAERERAANRRREIVRVARDIAGEAGWRAVSIRKIGERVNYTHPVLYQHFSTKRDLFVEVFRQSLEELGNILGEAEASARSPEEGLLAMARAYWNFARQHWGLYQVLNEDGETRAGVDAPAKSGLDNRFWELLVESEARERLVGVIGRIVPGEILSAQKAEILWAQLHGLVMLSRAGRIIGAEWRGEAMVDEAVRDLIRGWQTSQV